jgi:hypothetical protein
MIFKIFVIFSEMTDMTLMTDMTFMTDMTLMTDMSLMVLPAYMIGTISGSVLGVKISMKIESWLGATSDGHINNKK